MISVGGGGVYAEIIPVNFRIICLPNPYFKCRIHFLHYLSILYVFVKLKKVVAFVDNYIVKSWFFFVCLFELNSSNNRPYF